MPSNDIGTLTNFAGGIAIGAASIGSSAPPNGVITAVWAATAVLDFPSVAAAATQALTITISGIAAGDVVDLGLHASPAAGIIFQAYVSAANTVTLTAINITASPVDPTSASYHVVVKRVSP